MDRPDVELLQLDLSQAAGQVDQLTALGLSNDRAGFARLIHPLDLGAADAGAIWRDLTTHPEADGTIPWWRKCRRPAAGRRSGSKASTTQCGVPDYPSPVHIVIEVITVYCNNHSNNNGGGGMARSRGITLHAMVCELECNQQQTMHSCMDQNFIIFPCIHRIAMQFNSSIGVTYNQRWKEQGS
jgi:hypothetical protein